jgi:hypothetical protein
MRLLPKTPRGTWALAGVAWVAACAVVWWVLPVVPRATWRLPDGGKLIGFFPGSHAVLTVGTGSSPNRGAEYLCGPADVRNADTGRVDRLLGPDAVFDPFLMLPDAVLILDRAAPPVTRLTLVDVPSGRRSELPLSFVGASADFGTLAFLDPRTSPRVIRLWDTATRRNRGALTGLYGFPGGWLSPGHIWRSVHRGFSPAVFSPDGRHLVCCEPAGAPGAGSRMLVWGVGEEEPAVIMSMPGDDCRAVALGRGGRSVVVELARAGGPAGRVFRRYEVGRPEPTWEVTSLDDLVAISGGEAFAAAVRPAGAARAAVWLWDGDGRPPGREVPGLGDDMPAFFSGDWVSPDGRSVLTAGGAGGGLWTALQWLRETGVPVPDMASGRAQVVDTASGRVLFACPLGKGPYLYSSDGQLLAAQVGADVRVWDMPPRTPMTWFPAAAMLLALPVASFAHRRARRLRRAAA